MEHRPNLCYKEFMNFYAPRPQAEIKKEREKARKLKNSSWWKQKLQAGICYYCEKHVDVSELTMDHKVPIARGGSSSRENIVPSCKACNTDKGSKTTIETILEKKGSGV